jgi:hypothetical protein
MGGIKYFGGKRPKHIMFSTILQQLMPFFLTRPDFVARFLNKFVDYSVVSHIMLRDELTQKFSHFDKITVFGYPRAK